MEQTRDILYTFNFSNIWHTVKCAKFQIILVSENIFDLNIANSNSNSNRNGKNATS